MAGCDESDDLLVARVASRQRGRVGRGQLLAAGLTRGAIAHRIRTGRLIREHRGVFVVGHVPSDPLGPPLGALMACGERAVLGLCGAAAVAGFAPVPAAPFDVIVPLSQRAARPGLRLHHHALTRPDVMRCEGMLITTPAMTLVHLAAACPEPHLERLVAEAFAQRLITRASVLDALARHPRAGGGQRLRAMLATDLHRARSHPERDLHKALIEAGLPRAHLNLREGAWTPDLVWPDLGLVVEIDSYAFHSSPRAFARDRRKDRAQRNDGREVLRVLANEVRDHRLLVVADVARAIERRTLAARRAA